MNTYDTTYDNTNANTYDNTNDNTHDTTNDITYDTPLRAAYKWFARVCVVCSWPCIMTKDGVTFGAPIFRHYTSPTTRDTLTVNTYDITNDTTHANTYDIIHDLNNS